MVTGYLPCGQPNQMSQSLFLSGLPQLLQSPFAASLRALFPKTQAIVESTIRKTVDE